MMCILFVLLCEDVITHFLEISLFVLCSCVRKGSIGDETHLKIKILKGVEIGYEIHSHLLHEVRKLYMRNIQE